PQHRRRVVRRAVEPDLEVQVRPGRVAEVADQPDGIAGLELLAVLYGYDGEVGVQRLDAAAVVDAHEVAGPVGVLDRDGAGAGREDRRARRRGEVEAGVLAGGPELAGLTESGRDHVGVRQHRQVERTVGVGRRRDTAATAGRSRRVVTGEPRTAHAEDVLAQRLDRRDP